MAIFPGSRSLPRLAVGDRQELVVELREEGMSARAIAAVAGVGHRTVVNDLASTEDNSSVDRVVGLDGKSRPATRPDSYRLRC